MSLSKYWRENALLWLQAAAVRAVKTAAQSALAVLPTSAAVIGSVDWAMVAGTAALAAVMSLLTSLVGVPEVDDGTSVVGLVKAPESNDGEE